jgi:hypothetical protein
MAGKLFGMKSPRALTTALTLALLLSLFPAAAQQAAAAQNAEGESSAGNPSVSYYFEADEKGNPVFTQVLSWDADPNALKFEVSVKNSDGFQVAHAFIETNSYSMKLLPGQYSYNIVTWNLLGQPEIETGWQPLTVAKAEMPSISSVWPVFLFLDSMNGKITLKGQLLAPGAKIYLKNAFGRTIPGTEVGRVNDSELELTFPDKELATGTYDIVVVNPGGLSATDKDAIRIMFEHPVDILLTLGYSPVMFFQDSWFKENWSEPVYWLGANAGLSVYFQKKSWGYLGVEAAAAVHRLTGGDEQAKLTSDYLLSGGNFLYKYRFNKNFFALARAGGGIASSKHSFDYKGNAGPTTESSNIYLDSGLAFQYFFPMKIFAELGADWIEIMEKGHAVGGVQPALKIGYQIF